MDWRQFMTFSIDLFESYISPLVPLGGSQREGGNELTDQNHTVSCLTPRVHFIHPFCATTRLLCNLHSKNLSYIETSSRYIQQTCLTYQYKVIVNQVFGRFSNGVSLQFGSRLLWITSPICSDFQRRKCNILALSQTRCICQRRYVRHLYCISH